MRRHRRTDRYDTTNGRFSQFCEHAYKLLDIFSRQLIRQLHSAAIVRENPHYAMLTYSSVL